VRVCLGLVHLVLWKWLSSILPQFPGVSGDFCSWCVCVCVCVRAHACSLLSVVLYCILESVSYC